MRRQELGNRYAVSIRVANRVPQPANRRVCVAAEAGCWLPILPRNAVPPSSAQALSTLHTLVESVAQQVHHQTSDSAQGYDIELAT